MSSATPHSFPHPGSPPSRPELPDGAYPPGAEPPLGPGAPAPAPVPEPRDLPGWPPWTPFAAMLLTLVGALVGVAALTVVVDLLGVSVDADDPPPGVTIGGTLIQDFALIASAVVLARATAGRPWAGQFGIRTTRFWPAFWWLVAAWVVFILFSAVWAAALGIDESDDLPAELGADESTLALIAVAVLVTVVAPIAEEFFFRGFCFTALRRWLGLVPAVALTGVIFGAIHLGGTSVEFLAPLAVFGALLCLLYVKTGSILPCMVLHALNNSLALGVTQGWSWEVPLVMVGSCAVIVVLMRLVIRSPRLSRPALAAPTAA